MATRLQSELQDLEERYAVKVGDMTADEIERLVLACRRVESPFSNVNVEVVGAPVRVCRGVYGWPLTVGAFVWLDEFARRWWPDGLMFEWAQVYAMIHGRDKGAFERLTDKAEARKAILKTALRLVCHGGEVRAALAKCCHSDDDQCPEPPKANGRVRADAQTNWVSLVARLEVQSGIPADEWLWSRSFFQTMKAYEEMHAFAAAFAAGAEKSRMLDELDAAINDLQRLKAAIGRRVEAERRAKTDADAEEAER